MASKYLVWVGTAASVWAAVAAGCAKGNVTIEEDDSSSSGGGSSSGSGGSISTNNGGSGGGTNNACGIDCGTIQTPDCQQSVCNQATAQCEIVPVSDGQACEDGLFCTMNDSCVAGDCVAGPPNDCGMSPQQCNVISCDETSKTCSNAPDVNGAACQDPNNLCMVNMTCTNGLCTGGTVMDCFFAPVPGPCYVSVCNPSNGMCEPQTGNEGQACVDQNDLCSVGNTCAAGVCTGGSPKDCSALSVGCNNGVCDGTTGQCVQQPIMQGQTCLEATDDCNQGICDANGNCVGNPINNGMMCDDGLTCTSNTTCTNGVCGGGTSNVSIYFSEDFSSNSAGWTVGQDWQIGAATASSCGSSITGNDPGQDHSPSADNGVAGVILGGCYPTTIHTDYCLVSPNINTATATGSVFLSYWRHLHTDYPSFITSKVDVSSNGGTSWTTLYSVPSGQFQNDAAWTQASFDVTAQKSATFRVRFCYAAGSSGIITGGGWNVDDVLLASGVCN